MRHPALSDMAPTADDALLEGIEESPTEGRRWRKPIWKASRSRSARSLDRAAAETGRWLHAAAVALLGATGAARLPVEVTPEMVAVAAITELGDGG